MATSSITSLFRLRLFFVPSLGSLRNTPNMGPELKSEAERFERFVTK